MRRIILKGSFIDLNEYINIERMNKFAAAQVKKDETNRVAMELKINKYRKIKKPVFLKFSWFVKNKRKDKDNIAFATKFILDGMVEAGILENDGWDYVVGFSHRFFLSKDERVEIGIEYPSDQEFKNLFKRNK